MVIPHFTVIWEHMRWFIWVFASAVIHIWSLGVVQLCIKFSMDTNINDVSNHAVVEERSAFAFLSDQIYDKTGRKKSHRHALWSENPICGRSDVWSIMGLRVRVPVCVVKLVFLWSADTPTPSRATGVWRTEWRTSIRFPHHIPSASHSRPSASPSASPTGKHTHDSETMTILMCRQHLHVFSLHKGL